MRMNYKKIQTSPNHGFTLLELMVTIAILSIVFGVVANGIILVQQRNTVEVNKVDLTQETRQFMDQITNDIHQAGFPTIRMFDPVLAYTTASNQVAAGLTQVTSNEVDFQGDVDGTGTVSDVVIRVVPAGGPCPCTIQRGTVAKTVGGAPVYYTELDNLQNPAVFTAYGSDGSVIPLPTVQDLTGVALKNINAIGITLWVQSTTPDPKTGAFPTVTMVSQAKLDNNNW